MSYKQYRKFIGMLLGFTSLIYSYTYWRDGTENPWIYPMAILALGSMNILQGILNDGQR